MSVRWSAALAALALGIALRNCVFLTASPLLALAGFYDSMDRMRGERPLSAAGRCVAAGITALAAAAVMMITLLTGMFGFWPPVDITALLGGAVLAVSGLLVRRAVRAHREPAVPAINADWLIAVVATFALGLAANGAGWVACAFAGGALATAGVLGWHLAHDIANALFRAGSER